MNKNILKTFTVLVSIIMIISIASNVFALTPADITGSTDANGSDEILSLGQSVVGILQTVGIVISVVVLIIIGIKYMMGSAEEKAEYKKTMIPYVVGAVLIFAASVFANVVYEFANGING